jgi:hypothetical protein
MADGGVSALQQAIEQSNRQVRELRMPLEHLVEEGNGQMLIYGDESMAAVLSGVVHQEGENEIGVAHLFSDDEVWMVSNTEVAHTRFVASGWRRGDGVSQHRRRQGDNNGGEEGSLVGEGHTE